MNVETLIAAILTLAIFSFLYRDNPLYKFAEHLLVGISVGYSVMVAVFSTIGPKLFSPLGHRPTPAAFVSLLLALFLLARLVPRWAWVSRLALSLMIGAGAGLAIPAMLQARILSQLQASLLPLTSLNNILIVVGIVTTLLYFYFSREQKGVWKGTAVVGTYFLMVFFGATFGNTVMSRISLLIGRLEFLLGDFLGLIR